MYPRAVDGKDGGLKGLLYKVLEIIYDPLLAIRTQEFFTRLYKAGICSQKEGKKPKECVIPHDRRVIRCRGRLNGTTESKSSAVGKPYEMLCESDAWRCHETTISHNSTPGLTRWEKGFCPPRMALIPELVDALRLSCLQLDQECPENIKNIRRRLLDYFDSRDEQQLEELRVAVYRSLPTNDAVACRALYADICIAQCLLDIQDDASDTQKMFICIQRLDGALVFSGAPGRQDSVHALIKSAQSQLPKQSPSLVSSQTFLSRADHEPEVPECGGRIQEMQEEPDMMQFLNKYSKVPFIVRGGIRHWPAVEKWTFPAYLLSITGRGRVVPVEVGKDYRVDGWNQTMMSWEAFLQHLEKKDAGDEPLYLAQHSLLSQFPALREDVVVPDLVYYAPTPSPDTPGYSPPNNDEGLIINAWLGPFGTISPAHQDPYFNCYAQVVGRKTVWLASPALQEELRPLPQDSGLGNTSTLDVFSLTRESNPTVLERSMVITLQPGDLLFFPPQWWHAMRSEDTSFSVSFWF